MLVGVTALVTGSSRAGILSVIVLFAGGAALLWKSHLTDRSAGPGRAAA